MHDGALIRSLKVAVHGLDFMAHPLYIHTYMHDGALAHFSYTTRNTLRLPKLGDG
jgi:hypothetical protein